MTTLPRSITIELLTGTSIGQTSSDVLEPDLVVSVDELGLPVIPASRILARLRDSANMAVGARLIRASTVQELIGEPGSWGLDARVFTLGSDATLPLELSSFLTDYSGSDFNLREITSLFTFDERSTSNDEVGGPLTGSLRTMRRVRAGLVFCTPIVWHRIPSESQVRALATMVLGLEQIGHRSTRGWGYIQACLDGNFQQTQEIASRYNLELKPESPKIEKFSGKSNRISVSLTLKSSMIPSRFDSELSLIPGQELRSAVHKLISTDSKLAEELVINRGASFAPGWPARCIGGQLVPFAPAPITLIDTAEGERYSMWDSQGWGIGRPKRVRGIFDAQMKHISELSTERIQRLNRAENQYYESQVIKAGETFVSEICLTDPSLAGALIRLLDGSSIRLGANRDSGFGGSIEVNVDVSNRPLWPNQPVEQGEVDLTLRSPAIVRSTRTGEIDPSSLGIEMQSTLKRSGFKVEIIKEAIVVSAVRSAGHRYLGPRAVLHAAGPGSTIRVKFDPAPTQEQWLELANTRVGERTIDGYGIWSAVSVVELAKARPEIIDPLLPHTWSSNPTPTAGFRGLATVLRQSPASTLGRAISKGLRDFLPEVEPTNFEVKKVANRPIKMPTAASTLEITNEIVLLSDTALLSGQSETREREDSSSEDPETQELMLLYRDEEGRPTLRGTTVAGLLRHELRRQRGLAETDDSEIELLLGKVSRNKSEINVGSRLTILDAVLADTNTAPNVARYIAIDEKSNIADSDNGALFAMEVLPAGTRFVSKWRLELPSEVGNAQSVLEILADAADGVQSRSIAAQDQRSHSKLPANVRLGARSGKGNGLIAAENWNVEVFNTSKLEDWKRYFGVSPSDRYRIRKVGTSVTLREILPVVKQSQRANVRPRIQVDGFLRVGEPVTFGKLDEIREGRIHYGYSGVSDSADGHQNVSKISRKRLGANNVELPVEPGTGVHGVLKSYARRELARLVGGSIRKNTTCKNLLESVFGSDPRTGNKPSRIRLMISEFTGGSIALQPRIALDPISQSTRPGRLFFEEGYYGGGARFHLETEISSGPERGILWVVLWGLQQGLVGPFGGLGNRGYGRRILTGASVSMSESSEPMVLDDLLSSGDKQLSIVDSDFRSLLQTLRLPSGAVIKGAEFS